MPITVGKRWPERESSTTFVIPYIAFKVVKKVQGFKHIFSFIVCLFLFFKTGFHCVALTILELAL